MFRVGVFAVLFRSEAVNGLGEKNGTDSDEQDVDTALKTFIPHPAGSQFSEYYCRKDNRQAQAIGMKYGTRPQSTQSMSQENKQAGRYEIALQCSPESGGLPVTHCAVDYDRGTIRIVSVSQDTGQQTEPERVFFVADGHQAGMV